VTVYTSHTYEAQILSRLDTLVMMSRLENKLEDFMSALDNLNQNIADLKASVDSAVGKLSDGSSEVAIQAAADAVGALKVELDNALVGPVTP